MDDKKLVELIIDDDNEKAGVFAVSIVEEPAIQENFIALSEQDIYLKVDDEDKRILTGALLVADKPILRLDENNDPYYIFFTKETIEKASQKFLKDFNQKEITLEHNSDVKDVTIIESWLVADKNNDKSNSLGLNVPSGTWMISMKIDNAELWNKIKKTGIYNGFSLEGIFKKKEEFKEIKNKIINMEKTTEDNFWEKLKGIVTPEKKETKEPVIELGSLQDRLDLLESNLKAFESVVSKLTERITEKEQPEVKEEVKVEPKKEAKIEEPKEEKVEAKEVEMIAHTDKTETPIFEPNVFEYKLTVQERIKKELLKNI